MNTQNTDNKLQIGICVSPDCYIPDIIGVYTIFSVVPDCDIHFIWKHKELIMGYPSFPIHATTTFSECPENLDVLAIGATTTNILTDEETLAFLADRGNKAKYLIGICSGSLNLGAAGLLQGYRATGNFHIVDELAHFGAIPVKGGEVVIDRNRLTASPVSGSFDAALIVLGKLCGEDLAREIELTLEYAPHPPFGTGSPELAGSELTQKVLQKYEPMFNQYRQAVRQASGRILLKSSPTFS
ncbi:DJ-1/PfpI family protein [Nostoc sp. TCL26-01]|uniref:DJ-1/PfpI family protein n=1 Tax=Nostoc sp. TCL26-01 TaxID=2576904 RepID=UPI0015BCFD58|nr:DJ-1/PfpI family protein [Nostoc sp. TCL26-01]QLE57128.1 DJ-1/PfpI family protein [Nostoc sp. TCL26-01]